MERVSALVRRELNRMTVSKAWLVMTLVQPIAYLLLFALALTSQFGKVNYGGGQLSYIAFIIPGLIGLQTNQLFHVLVSLSSADRRFGVFGLVMMAGTKPEEYIFSAVVAHSLVAAGQGVLILLIGLPLTHAPLAVTSLGLRVVIAFAAWLASSILWSSGGLMIGLRIEKEERRDVLWALLNLPLMFSSSVFYNVQQAPSVIRVLSYANPLTYCADVLRASMYGDPLVNLWKLGLLAALAAAGVCACRHIVRNTPLTRTVA